MKRGLKQIIWQGPVILGLVALDQWVKAWVYNNLKGQGPVVWIRDVFELTYVENRGAAFGMLSGWSWLFYVLTPLSLVLIGYLLYRISREKKYWIAQIGCLMIMAGAVGNLIDRLVRGFVVDMFYFKLINFAVFNVADSYIVVGMILLAGMILFSKEFSAVLFPEKKEEEEKNHV